MKIAVIPARGGSKRIPRKNIKPFYGKPIIAWSIEAALNSGCFDQVIVSTDDEEVAEVARAYGAATPFARPAALSDDYTGTTPVIAHAIEWANANAKQQIALACCIYATAPFISTVDLKKGLDMMTSEGCDYAFAVASYAFPIQRAIRITTKQRVEMFDSTQFNTRSQDLEEAWHDAGQFCWGKAEAWLSGKPVFSQDAAPVVLPRYRVQDIDTLEDWVRAECLYRVMQETQHS